MLFEQTYAQSLALTSMFSYQHLSLLSSVAEEDFGEFRNFPKSQRITQNCNPKKSPTFVVHEGRTIRFQNRMYVYGVVGDKNVELRGLYRELKPYLTLRVLT